MDIIRTLPELRARLKGEPAIAFVPTMGCLHEGHINLTRIARERVGSGGCVVVSLFVNRLQFGPNEDFDRYPRAFDDDARQCEAAGVNVLFAPEEATMYPEPQNYLLDLPPIQHLLEGAIRPGHFRGVATVVLKLFNMVQPHIAVFGKKDYQQCRVIDNMVQQLALPVELVMAETVRADDGLALSSRNRYLSEAERAEAPRLNQVLRTVRDAIQSGDRDFETLEKAALVTLLTNGWQPNYVSVRRQLDLDAPTDSDTQLVVLAAAKLGTARLIDNLELSR